MRQHSIGVAEELDLLETMFSINLLQIGSCFPELPLPNILTQFPCLQLIYLNLASYRLNTIILRYFFTLKSKIICGFSLLFQPIIHQNAITKVQPLLHKIIQKLERKNRNRLLGQLNNFRKNMTNSFHTINKSH